MFEPTISPRILSPNWLKKPPSTRKRSKMSILAVLTKRAKTRGTWVMGKPATAFQRGDVPMYDSSLGWRFPNKRMAELYSLFNNGETAENVAEKYHISREDQDKLALASNQKALKAQNEG